MPALSRDQSGARKRDRGDSRHGGGRRGDGRGCSRRAGIAEHSAGNLDAARDYLEESTRLRRQAGLLPGVAANMVGLIYIAVAQGRHADALALAAEATEIARASDARVIVRQIAEASALAQA
jgi:hypothetical protein